MIEKKQAGNSGKPREWRFRTPESTTIPEYNWVVGLLGHWNTPHSCLGSTVTDRTAMEKQWISKEKAMETNEKETEQFWTFYGKAIDRQWKTHGQAMEKR